MHSWLCVYMYACVCVWCGNAPFPLSQCGSSLSGYKNVFHHTTPNLSCHLCISQNPNSPLNIFYMICFLWQKGQHLEPFIQSFFNSCESPKPKPSRPELTILSPTSENDKKVGNSSLYHTLTPLLPASLRPRSIIFRVPL